MLGPLWPTAVGASRHLPWEALPEDAAFDEDDEQEPDASDARGASSDDPTFPSPERRKWIHPAELGRVMRSLTPAGRPPVTPAEAARRGAITAVAMLFVCIGVLLLFANPPKGTAPEPRRIEHEAWLGVVCEERTVAAPEHGPTVREVLPASPAARSFEVGDVIDTVDGVEVGTPVGLRRAIEAHRPGAIVVVRFWRHGALETVSVTLSVTTVNPGP